MASTVIVFGPTGGVGSWAARTAAELGAKVILAMRDTSKTIPGLDETQGKFGRVEADLTKPETVREAAKSTSATRAFIYCAHGSQDGMKSTIEALKEGGVTLVVFLSSFTVRGDLAAIAPSEVIPYRHAQVELSLQSVMGDTGYVALRPGSFATNNYAYIKGIHKGEVNVAMPHASVDNITPEDMGRVAGTVLAQGPPKDGNRTIYLYGPKLQPQGDVIKTLAKALGKEVTVNEANEEQAYKLMTEERGVPPPVAKYMVAQLRKTQVGKSQVFGYAVSEEELSNVEKYSGKKAVTFEEWIEQNKDRFVA